MSDSIARKKVDGGEFAALCIGGFLLSIAYGVTFLIPVLVGQRGGDEALAGLIISAATVSTVILVILSGHIADAIGSARAVAVSGLFLAASALGFAMVPSAGLSLMIARRVRAKQSVPGENRNEIGAGPGKFELLGPARSGGAEDLGAGGRAPHAVVDSDLDAGDIGRIIRCQIERCLGDFVGFALRPSGLMPPSALPGFRPMRNSRPKSW
ncbi:membrane protein implicated in regulation of membrane protease activity [Rhizobium leguminosarum]|nr:membrane protein implicated in regulation of membrane protease activity [Rhizobium leguminosarum]